MYDKEYFPSFEGYLACHTENGKTVKVSISDTNKIEIKNDNESLESSFDG